MLSDLNNFNLENKIVLLRLDLDVPLNNGVVIDDTRLVESLPTIKFLLEKAKKVIVLGHLGRPEGKVVPELSLRPVAQKLGELLGVVGDFRDFREIRDIKENTDKLFILENLRFNPGEEKNDSEFTKELTSLGDFYVNEAFAVSHREHASIVGLPKLLPHAAGFHFKEEIDNLSRVLENPKRPLIFVIGGAKPETKLIYAEQFAKISDNVLIGGKLSQISNLKSQIQNLNLKAIIWAELTENGLDINEESTKLFSEIISKAGTIVWNGPMGKYEDEKCNAGTRKVAEAIVENKGFSLVGGGDTISALNKFGLLNKISYVSTGGGAMLEFLAKGTLQGIEALEL